MVSKAQGGIDADDLDDGLVYDVEFSEGEGESLSSNEALAEESKEDKSTEPRKRKRKGDKLKDKKRMKMEMEVERKKGLSKESSTEVMAEYINSRIREKNSDLSALELSELYINKKDIRSTAEFEEQRSLDNLSAFIKTKFNNMLPSKSKKAKKSKETKHDESERKFIAILSMSALRACDVHRATRALDGSSLKLINKNKVESDLDFVKNTKARVLCCTPGRLSKVLDTKDGSLSSDEIKIVILDNSYLDVKKQNIWDIKETYGTLRSLTENGSKIYLY